jgi:hypothetical protein
MGFPSVFERPVVSQASGTTGHASPQPIVMSIDANARRSSVGFLGTRFERWAPRADAEALSYGQNGRRPLNRSAR